MEGGSKRLKQKEKPAQRSERENNLLGFEGELGEPASFGTRERSVRLREMKLGRAGRISVLQVSLARGTLSVNVSIAAPPDKDF